MEHGEKNITIVDDQGNEQLCEVLFTFENEEFGKSYVLYYPIESKDDEEVEILASSFTPNEDGENGELQPIPEDSDAEWDMIEETLNTFLADEDEE